MKLQSQLVEWIGKKVPDPYDQAFWLCALIAIAPGLAANTLYPPYWYFQYIIKGNVPPVVTDPFPYLSIAVFAYMLAYCIRRRSYARIVTLLPIAIYWLLGRAELADYELYLLAAYSFVCFLSYVCWLTIASMRQWYFAVFIGLLVLYAWFEPVFATFQILEFLFWTVMLKIVIEFIVQNLEIFTTLGWAKFARLFVTACYYWSFMLIPLSIGLAIHIYTEAAIEDALYDSKIVVQRPIPETDGTQFHERDFWLDLNYTVDRHFIRTENEINAAIDSMKTRSGELKDTFPDEVVSQYDASVPKQFVDPDACTGITSPLCRGILGLVNEGFDLFKRRQRAKLRTLAEDLATDADKSTDEKLTEIKKRLNGTVSTTRVVVKTLILNAFRMAGLLNLFLNFLLIFAVFKSFFIVLARVIFKRENELFVSVSEHSRRMAKGTIRVPKVPHKYSVPASRKATWYNRNQIDWSGPEQQKAFPQWRSAVFSRLSNSVYLMNRMVMGKPQSTGAIFTTGRDNQFVEWTLKQGEEVIFDYAYFVAMTDTVKLKTVFSLKLSTLLLGKIFYSCATGPGKLVLMTGGDAIVGKTRHAGLPVAASRLVAWHRQARFEILANLTVLDTYTSEVSIRKRPADQIIINSKSEAFGTFGQLWRFIKVFIMPI
ncbi:MAG: AIM24 family protein [Rhizobiaceae bacterium]